MSPPPRSSPAGPPPRPGRSRRSRGNYSGMLVLSLPTLIGSGALVVDLSTQKVVRTQLQAVADISAMAGTDLLDGTSEGVEAARAAAIRAALRNEVNGAPVALVTDNLQIGAWDGEVGRLDTQAAVEEMDSIQVAADLDGVPATLASLVFDRDHLSVRGASTGFKPPDDAASAVGCYLPIAIPSCLFQHYTTDQLQDVTLVLNPAGVDNMGWGRVGGHPNANFLRDQIWDCEQDGIIGIGDEVGLQNGVVSSAMAEVRSAIVASTTRWDTEAWGPQPARMSGSALSAAEYGRTLEGAIIIFDGGAGYCQGSGGPFNGYEPLVGFAWAVVYDVRTSGGASQKNMKMKIDTLVDRSVGLRGGGGFFAGVTYDNPALIIR